MRTAGNILRIVSRQSPILLLRESVWRIRKEWNKNRLTSRIMDSHCPVRFRSLPYYRLIPGSEDDFARDIICGIADEVCMGRFPLLSYETAALGFPPPWHLDFVSGKQWELAPSGRLRIVRHDGSDVKAPWELSRLQHLPVLGKAHVLSGKDGYRHAAKTLLSDWIDRNPVGMGVNWTVPMEAALRSISIILLVNLLWPLRPDENPWLEKVTSSLWHHLLYIEAHLEFSHIARSNHYLSNIVGLLAISLSLEGKGMAAKRRAYQQLVEREILHQVHEDGGDYEASSGYHVLVTQLFTTALLLLRSAQAEVKASFRNRLQQMYHWMTALADDKGSLPHVGDCDDGRVEWMLDDLRQMLSVSLPERDSLQVSSLIGMGETLFVEAPSNARNVSTSHRLPVNSPASTVCSTRVEALPITIFPHSGIAVSRFGDAQLLFFAIPNGIHGKGSHTHNDKLSLIVRLDGKDMLCDSGTGCYSRDAARRNYFRSTPAHNTAVVNRAEQNDIPDSPNGLFSLADEAQVTPIEQFKDGEHLWLRASHFGYKKIGVIHTRALKLMPTNGVLIEDTFSGNAECDIDLHFHFSRNWNIGPIDNQSKEVRICLEGTRDAELRVRGCELLAAEKRSAEISRLYGNTVDAEEVVVQLNGNLPLTICSELKWEL